MGPYGRRQLHGERLVPAQLLGAGEDATPFFFIDPYVGFEINLGNHMALLIRIDYMLPFGTTSSKLTENVKWSNFRTPSGPRLYVGIMFGKLGKK